MLADTLTPAVLKPGLKRTLSGITGIADDAVYSNTLGIQMVTQSDGTPLIALSLVLERQPTSQDSIRPLIKSGVLTFDLKLNTSNLLENFYAREAAYTIQWSDGTTTTNLAQSESQGTEARTSFSINLTQAQSLDALSMLQYQTSSFTANVAVTTLEDGVTEDITMKGLWKDISTFLSENSNDQSLISKPALRALFPALQKLNFVSTINVDNEPVILPQPQFEKMFMRQAGVILKETYQQGSSDVSYEIRPVTYAGFELNYTEKVTRNSEKQLTANANLDELLKSIPAKIEIDKFVFLVAQQGSEALPPLPVKSNIYGRAASRDITDSVASRKLAFMNGRLTSMSLATRPVISDMQFVKPVTAEISANTRILNYVNIDLNTKVRPRSLPVVTDPNAAFFNDRIVDTRAWHIPKFVAEVPAQSADPETSSFLFSYVAGNPTPAGKPSLKGTLHLSFKLTLPQEAQIAATASGRTELLPVNMLWLTVNLMIPFTEEVSGDTKQQIFPAKVALTGDILTADVEFSNDWVRLAYGSLSTAGFQSVSAEVQIGYAFSCYNIVETSNYEVIYGAKSYSTHVLYPSKLISKSVDEPEEQDISRGYIDAEKLTFEHPFSTIQFKREPPHNQKASKDMLSAGNFIFAKPLQPMVAATVKPVAYLRPNVWSTVKPIQYNISAQVVSTIVPLLFPCNELGNFYQQLIDNEPQAIGCQDALKLGEIKDFKEYEEITELHDEQYSVYRALPQPGRFVVVPERFCVSRREAGEEDAYRPLIFLNALIDTKTPVNDKIELRVTMQPDIPIFKIKQLSEKLKTYHPEPDIEYSVEVRNQGIDVSWSLSPEITATSETEVTDASGPFVSAYFGTSITGWQLLQSVLTSPGLSGRIFVNLPDGSQFLSNLFIKLDTVRGTWLNGPLDLLAANGNVILTNKTKGKINVNDLVRYEGDTIADKVTVGATLDTDASITVAAADDLIPTYTYALGDPVAIEEIRSYVEDIHSSFAVINLVNFNNHNLLQLDIEAKVRGLDEVHQGTLTDTDRVKKFEYILPLTTYLTNPTLDYRVNKVFSDRPAEQTAWLTWDLNDNSFVSLTPDLLTL